MYVRIFCFAFLFLLVSCIQASSRQGVLIDSSWVLTYKAGDQPAKVWVQSEEKEVDGWEDDGDLQILHLSNPVVHVAPVSRARLTNNAIFDQLIKISQEGSAEGASEVQVGGNHLNIHGAELAGEGLYARVSEKLVLFGIRSNEIDVPIPLSEESNTWIDNKIIQYALKFPLAEKPAEQRSIQFLYDTVARFDVRLKSTEVKGILIDSSWVLVSEKQSIKVGAFCQIGIKDKIAYGTVDKVIEVSNSPFLMCHLEKPVTNITPIQRARRGTEPHENLYLFGKKQGSPLERFHKPPYSVKAGAVFLKSSLNGSAPYLLDELINLDGTNAIPLDVKTNTAIDNIIIASALSNVAVQAPALGEVKVKWNVLVYANDQDFEGTKAFIELMNSITGAATSKDIRILVQHRRYPHFDYCVEPPKVMLIPKEHTKTDVLDDFVGTRRFIIQGNGEAIRNAYGSEGWASAARSRIKQIELKENIDPGTESTFRDFLVWGMTFPAERTILCIWAHGIGWRWISNAENNLKAYQFGNALQQGLGKKIELIRLDSCRSQMAELLYQIKGNAEYVMGSEETTPLDFMIPSYDEMITILETNIDKTSKEVSEIIWAKYTVTMNRETAHKEGWYQGAQGWTPKDGYTVSLVNDTKVTVLKNQIDRLATLLINSLNDPIIQSLQTVRNEIQKYGDPKDYFVDLWDLADRISKIENLPVVIFEQCKKLKEFIEKEFVLKTHYLKDKLKNTHGVSIDFSPAEDIKKIDYKDLEFAKNGTPYTWYDFLLKIR